MKEMSALPKGLINMTIETQELDQRQRPTHLEDRLKLDFQRAISMAKEPKKKGSRDAIRILALVKATSPASLNFLRTQNARPLVINGPTIVLEGLDGEYSQGVNSGFKFNTSWPAICGF